VDTLPTFFDEIRLILRIIKPDLQPLFVLSVDFIKSDSILLKSCYGCLNQSGGGIVIACALHRPQQSTQTAHTGLFELKLVFKSLGPNSPNPRVAPGIALIQTQNLYIEIVDKTAGDDRDKRYSYDLPLFLQTFERLENEIVWQYRHQQEPTQQDENDDRQKATENKRLAEVPGNRRQNASHSSTLGGMRGLLELRELTRLQDLRFFVPYRTY
jgi:hypothetical protein